MTHKLLALLPEWHHSPLGGRGRAPFAINVLSTRFPEGGWRLEASHGVTDFSKLDEAAAICSTLMPVDAVLVCPFAELAQADDPSTAIEQVTLSAFLALRALYRPLMRQRKGSLWITGPSLRVEGKPMDTVHGALVRICASGLSMLASIAALELSRKGVTACFVDCTGDTTSQPSATRVRHIADNGFEASAQLESVYDLIEWATQRSPIYLTAERIDLRSK